MSSVRPSVCLSVPYHKGWNTSKIISRPISWRFVLGMTQTWAIWCNGNTPKLGWNRGGVMSAKNLQLWMHSEHCDCLTVPCIGIATYLYTHMQCNGGSRIWEGRMMVSVEREPIKGIWEGNLWWDQDAVGENQAPFSYKRGPTDKD